jgi:CyaY protein
MDNSQYDALIEDIFTLVEDSMEALPEDPDVSSAPGVINVTFPNGIVFVFSRQPPIHQLWLATPGGGFHYEWDETAEDWRDTKTAALFRPFVIEQIREHTGIEFAWQV